MPAVFETFTPDGARGFSLNQGTARVLGKIYTGRSAGELADARVSASKFFCFPVDCDSEEGNAGYSVTPNIYGQDGKVVWNFTPEGDAKVGVTFVYGVIVNA